MSLITRVATAAPSAAAARASSAQKSAALAVVAGTRPFSTTTPYQKGPLETGKEALKKVDRAVSDVAVKGIEKGEQARDKIKDTVGEKGQEARRQAEQAAGQAKDTAQKAFAQVQEKLSS
ncbi:hypothetical protein VTN02DRAFT_3211 [Thermoascus thermophilus]